MKLQGPALGDLSPGAGLYTKDIIYRKVTLRYSVIQGAATVINKSGENTAEPIGMFDECNVYVRFNGEEICFENEALHGRVKVGDTVNVITHIGRNKNGEVKHVYRSIK